MVTKVLIISQHFPPDKSGNASRIHDMASHLSNNDTNVIIFSPYPSFPHGIFEREYGVFKKKKIKSNLKLVNLFTWQPKTENPHFLSRMAYYLIFPIHSIFWCFYYHNKYDIIITSAPPIFTLIPGLFSKLILNKKWIIDKRDMWIDASISLGFIKKDGLSQKLAHKFVNLCFKNSNGILVTTEGIQKKLLLRYHHCKNIFIVPNGVDPQFFSPYSKNKKRNIVYAGNIGHAQDLESFISAMEILKDSTDINFLIVGEGDNKKNLKSMVKEKKLEDRVIFTGLVERREIPKIISESLIGIAPLKNIESLDYAVPSKIYEYMACETPFIVTGMGQVEKLADESKAGIFVDNNPEKISEVILTLINNPEILEEMGKNGRNYVKIHYSRAEIAFTLKKIIKEIG